MTADAMVQNRRSGYVLGTSEPWGSTSPCSTPLSSLVSGPYREYTLQPMTVTEEETPGILLKSTRLDGDRERG